MNRTLFLSAATFLFVVYLMRDANNSGASSVFMGVLFAVVVGGISWLCSGEPERPKYEFTKIETRPN